MFIVKGKYQISAALYNKKSVEFETGVVFFFRTHINSTKHNNLDSSK